MKVKCNKCGYVGDESEFPKERDFFQHDFIARCANKACDNRQNPGDASLRMFGGERPFVYIRGAEPRPIRHTRHTALRATLHRSREAG